MAVKLLVATQNPGKFAEIAEVLSALPLELVSLRQLALADEVEETEATHEGNAIIKARYFLKKTGIATLAEDSGIHVDALPGELGVFTRRFRGLHSASDGEWLDAFLREMAGVPLEKRTARFVCVAALIMDTEGFGAPLIFHGETLGVITEKIEAPLKAGIPISSCFCPDGYDTVYAALSVEEKNKVSHRGKAMHAVADHLRKTLL